jgi:glycosyltransferase involved in cell wall biosynthesis
LNTANRNQATYAAILTTFNAEKTVARSVESILNQRTSPAEIIIIDDFSTDSTLQVLQDNFSHIPNLKIIVNPVNTGQSYSRNIAVNFATSDVIIIFDDDDISSPDRANMHLELYAKGSDISYVSSIKKYSDSYEINCENEDRMLVKLEPTPILERLVLGRKSSSLGETWIPASTSAFDRKYFLSIGGYDVQMRRLEDAEIIVKAAMNGCICSWSSTILVTRMSTRSGDKGGAIETVFEKLFLSKYQNLLSKSDLKLAINLIEFRDAYFSKNLLRMVRLAFLHPSLLFGPQGRFFAFAKRCLHDIRQGR